MSPLNTCLAARWIAEALGNFCVLHSVRSVTVQLPHSLQLVGLVLVGAVKVFQNLCREAAAAGDVQRALAVGSNGVAVADSECVVRGSR